MKTAELTGVVCGVYLARQPDASVSEPVDLARVTFSGFEGDRHAGLTMQVGGRHPHYSRGTEIRNTRQVTILSAEELSELAQALGVPEVRAEWLSANLVVSGFEHFSQLPPATRLFFAGEATLVVDAENPPCLGPGRVIQSHYPDVPGVDTAFVKAALHRRGVVAWVERPGQIQPGDGVSAQVP